MDQNTRPQRVDSPSLLPRKEHALPAPTKQLPSRSAYSEERKDWSCSACTFINHPAASKCKCCKTSREHKEQEQASGWKGHGFEQSEGHSSKQEAFRVVNPIRKPARKGIDEREFRLVLIGMTGVGKSATGNTILNEECFKSEACQDSITERCEYIRRDRCGKAILVVDTPGLLDTRMDKKKISKEIKKCIAISAPGPHAFLLVTSIYNRFTDAAAAVFNEMDAIFGENMKSYLIVVFTGKDALPPNKSIEEYADRSPQKLKDILSSAGGGYMAFGNKDSYEKREHDVQELLQKVEEMIKKNRESHFTSEMFDEAERIMQERINEEIKEEKKRQKIQESLRENEEKLKEDLAYFQHLNRQNEVKVNELKTELDAAKKKKPKKKYTTESERELEELVWQEMTNIQMKNKLLKQKQEVDGPQQVQIERKLADLGKEISKIAIEKKRVEDEVTDEVLSLKVREEERNKIEKEDEDEGAFGRLIQCLKKGGGRFLKFFK